jgi:D-glycero-D-manno-heptose 1,7-bisphosphate phosphatase
MTAELPVAGARRAALFLDRDGVINVDHGYVCRPEQFEFVPGIFELVRFAVHTLGWPVIVTTNQAGIGRGYFDEAAFQTLTEWMCERFRRERAPIAKVYHCPYHLEHGIGPYRADHDWRKPKPGMFLQAAADLNLDLSRSAVVGDKISDIEAGANAGVLLRIRLDARALPPPADAPPADAPPHHVVCSLPEALRVLRARLLSDPSAGQAGLAGQPVKG